MTPKINHAFPLCLIMLISGLLQITVAQSSFWEPVGDLDGKIITKLSFTRNRIIFAGSDSGIFRSGDLGESWVKPENGIPEERIYDLKANSRDEIFAATRSGLYFSANEGGNWENRTSNLNLKWIRSIAVSGADSLFIGAVDSAQGYPGSIYFSSDNGLSWLQINNGLLFQSVFVKDFMVDKQDTVYIIAAHEIIQSEYLYKYIQSDQNWVQVFRYPPGIETGVLKSNPINIFFGGASDGMWKSTDEGKTWVSAHLYPKFIETVVTINDSSLYAGTGLSGIFYSENNGETWTAKNSGLTNPSVLSLIHHSSGYLFAGTSGGGVFRSTNPITTIHDDANNAVNEFKLQQNYPNPFNPTTTISYEVPESGHVELKIYNTLGQLVRTVVDEQKSAGRYNVRWDGKDRRSRELPSGNYFYQLSVNDFISVKRMVKLK